MRYLILLLIPAALLAQPAGPWKLSFQDEFNGTSLNTAVWDTTYPWGCHNNDELEGYGASAVTETGGHAALTATHSNITCSGSTYNYTSGLIQATKSFSQTYGYWEARMKIPASQGNWPAFWVMPQNGNWPPEIDFIELGKSGDFTTARMTLHWGTNGSDNYQENDWTNTGTAFGGNYHVYACNWENGVVTWYIDGVQRATMSTSNVSSIAMYPIINLAIGGSYTGGVGSTTYPQELDVDYIRVWTYTPGGCGTCYSTIPSPTDPIPNTNGTQIAITTASLPNGTQGSPYSQSLSASGGATPYGTWSLSSGSLPSGLSLSTAGAISGTPNGSTGTSNFTAQVLDANGQPATKALSLTVGVGGSGGGVMRGTTMRGGVAR